MSTAGSTVESTPRSSHETTMIPQEGNGRLQTETLPLPFGHDLPDEEVFKKAPREDCPICCLELPNIYFIKQLCYQACCGKMFCIGCMHEIFRGKVNRICPFCRSSTDKCYSLERLKKRADLGDYKALYNLGMEYRDGKRLKKNEKKMMALLHQAAELGSVNAHVMLVDIYRKGLYGVAISRTKAEHHMLAAAMGGNSKTRHNIGAFDISYGHFDRGIKHLLISAGDGFQPSVVSLQELYSLGVAKKDDYDKALQAYQAYIDATWSSRREESLLFYRSSVL